MRFLPLIPSLGLLLSAVVGCSSERPAASGSTAEKLPGAAVTTIYVVRHAEKETSPALTDPPLTPAGEQRALTLRDTLGSRNIEALYVTNTVRSRATAAPLATALQRTPQVYDKPADLAARILREQKGKTVLVVGHSNTLLPLVSALGATSEITTVEDGEYDYLFEVKVPPSGAATVVTHRFGAEQ
ncbi:Phosphoglycerate mutase [Hymenobacter roseosalivarius DSM 11622]|uniref:Phosphoglycerate mutase n=1 Tax=Hymenobacter roseosalivarius DSM 11622 TaxID=645990 RepID=A0A1W1W3H5_9BACT|nr:histidine phosphatase family protein [Hymenobacter roseosalivarius]SMC00188.1 Phosphoglycerate mutase [Hymenobacter roseosalivarius DSM 11622]